MPTAFPFACHWPERYRETRAFQTDVLIAEDGTEQRIRLRQKPRRHHRFLVRAMDPRTAGALNVALHTGPEVEWAVPFWPHAARLTATAATSATVLSVETIGRDFYAAQYAMLWVSPFSYALHTISTVGATSITLTAGLVAGWASGSMLVPCHAGRMDPEIAVAWLGSRLQDVPVAFTLDPLQLPASTGDGDLSQLILSSGGRPDRGAGPGDTVRRERWRLEADAGGFTDTLVQAAPRATQERYQLHLNSLAVASDFWGWYGSVLGRLNPVLLPTYQTDLKLTGAVAGTDTTITVQSIGYAARYPSFESRRHLAFLKPAADSITAAYVNSAVDNGNGTETLTLNGQVGVAIPAGQGKVSFLRLMRLVEDPVEMAWVKPGLAEASVALVECGDAISVGSGLGEWVRRDNWTSGNDQWWIYDPAPFEVFDLSEVWDGLEQVYNPNVALGGAGGYMYLEKEYGPYTPGHTVTFQCTVRVYSGNPAGSVNIIGIKVNQTADNELGVDPGALLTAEQSAAHTEVAMSTSAIVPAGGTVWVGLGLVNFEYGAPGGLILFYDPVVSVAP